MTQLGRRALDDPALGTLAAHARREHGDATGLLYAIRLEAADGRVLLDGRATIILRRRMRRALVTGGASPLGEAICRRLAADGLHVIVHAHANRARAAALAAELRRRGDRVRHHRRGGHGGRAGPRAGGRAGAGAGAQCRRARGRAARRDDARRSGAACWTCR